MHPLSTTLRAFGLLVRYIRVLFFARVQFSTTPLSYGSRLATIVYGLLLVIESWQLHVSIVTQVLTVLRVATLDSMHVIPIPAEA